MTSYIFLVAVCVSGCGSGTCIQPNKCQCSDGSVASTCSTHNSGTGKKESSVVVQKLGPSTFTSKSSEQQCAACVVVTHVMYTVSDAAKLVRCTFCNFLQLFCGVIVILEQQDCAVRCMNGGQCMSGRICVCPVGFRGPHCAQRT